MMIPADPASALSNQAGPFPEQLRLAVTAYLTRFKGSYREHTESDLLGGTRCYWVLQGMSNSDVTQRDLRSRSREIMDAVEHGHSFTVTRGRSPYRGTDPAAAPPPVRLP
jgi:hypothetical protein